METHRLGVGEPSLSDSGNQHHHHHHHHIPYGVPHMLNTSYINQEGPAFDFGELEEAIVLQGLKINNDHHCHKKQPAALYRPAATLEMFPSWPIRFQHHTPISSKSGEEDSTDSGSRFDQPESPISESKIQSLALESHRLPPPPEMDTAAGSGGSQPPPPPPPKQAKVSL